MDTSGTKGTERTRRFYDEEGWTPGTQDSVDRDLFGHREDGPIRQHLHSLHLQRIYNEVAKVGSGLRLLECGCGGNPQQFLLPLCSSYAGTDFSQRGIDMAQAKFAQVNIPHGFHVADVCALPFESGEFDAVYSAHMLYHIDDRRAQARALAELVRVTRPGGVLVLVVANPRPLLFPLRMAKRIAADTAIVGPVLSALRPTPPIPYRPMSLGWMRAQLAEHGELKLWTGAVPSTWFNQHVSEVGGLGKQLWRGVAWLEEKHPAAGAYLGNYVTIVLRKRA